MGSQGSKSCAAQPADCPLGQVAWEFKLTLTAQQLKRADIPSLAMHVVEQFEMADNKLSARLFLVLSELVNNALDHGLLKLDSALKHSRQGLEHYFEERSARLNRLEQGEIRLHLCKLANPGGQCLSIEVRDSGEGFDHAAAMSDAGNGINEKRHGRGIALVKSMCRVMHYNVSGSGVHVCLPIDGVRCA